MSDTGSVLIEIRGLVRDFGRVRAVDAVDLRVPEGEWVVVMGPSGSGKTTLLNILAGLDRPTAGTVRVADAELAGLSHRELARFRRETIGLVFQEFHLIPYLTALENVMLAQYVHSLTDKEEARQALERVGLGDRLEHLPSELSGGEKQRLCVARALVNHPRLVLADEPTGNLDEANERQVLEIFGELHREGQTLVVVTHNPQIARLADRVVELEHGRTVRDERHDAGPRPGLQVAL